ncbi:hypothetical protein [Pseudomonas corrugata]|uniref:hypothetical protein n=1 Tax=Pseudomonas corrugata TaxID=47879 RepID=UPI00087B3261|nr:hypothetical protein [Pseudomonas corrugata]SDU86939.1 hypothetical protein SAMN04490183_0830 [Pseudomonas corrugata]
MEHAVTLADINVRVSTEDTIGEMEIIEVKEHNEYHPKTHYLLIETQLKSHSWSSDKTSTSTARIKVRATYLYGSEGPQKAGSLISEMGGECSRQRVKLTNGSVMVNSSMQGLHVGTYLFHKIVSWAKQFDPSYKIVPISVIAGDGYKENKERRNKLYCNSGIRFIWDGPEGMQGSSDPTLTVSDLIAYANWPNINKDYGLQSLDKTWREISKLKEKVRGLKSSNLYYRREYKTLESRLKAIAGFLNLPMYILCLFLGIIIGKALIWHHQL